MRIIIKFLASFKKDLTTMGTTHEDSVKQKIRAKIMETFAYIQVFYLTKIPIFSDGQR